MFLKTTFLKIGMKHTLFESASLVVLLDTANELYGLLIILKVIFGVLVTDMHGEYLVDWFPVFAHVNFLSGYVQEVSHWAGKRMSEI